LYSTFGVQKILRPINHSLKIHGLSPTLKNIVEKTSRAFTINLPKNTQKTLKNDRVLLICNHPAQVDVLLLLASIPPRRKTFLVVMHGLLSILPAINKHLIPVYISHRIDNHDQQDWKFKLFQKVHFVPEYSKDTAHQKNIKSISLAAQKIDEGSLVAIFPAGGTKDARTFLPGVGYLIKNLKYPKKTKLVMAHVDGTSAWDFLRIIPFVKFFLPKFRVDFSETLNINNFTKGNGREISQKLQQVYDSWSRPYEPLPKFKYAALYLRSFFLFLLFKG
jgi:1-acyl-sn-glycerol-3-phosphate acyltransferase